MRLASNLELCIPPECWDININVHHVKSFTGSEELLAGEGFVQLSEYSCQLGQSWLLLLLRSPSSNPEDFCFTNL